MVRRHTFFHSKRERVFPNHSMKLLIHHCQFVCQTQCCDQRELLLFSSHPLLTADSAVTAVSRTTNFSTSVHSDFTHAHTPPKVWGVVGQLHSRVDPRVDLLPQWLPMPSFVTESIPSGGSSSCMCFPLSEHCNFFELTFQVPGKCKSVISRFWLTRKASGPS